MLKKRATASNRHNHSISFNQYSETQVVAPLEEVAEITEIDSELVTLVNTPQGFKNHKLSQKSESSGGNASKQSSCNYSQGGLSHHVVNQIPPQI